MKPRGRAAALTGLVLAGLLVAGCDEGSVLLVENQTDSDYIVRVTGTSHYNASGYQPDQIVATAPANSKRMVAEFGFHGPFDPQHLDVLGLDCAPIYSQAFYGTDGTYVVIDDNAVVSVRKEFPKDGEPAPKADTCRTVPVALPSQTPLLLPSPSSRPSPS